MWKTKKKSSKDSVVNETFQSINDLAAYIHANPMITHGKSSHDEGRSQSWDMGMGYDDAIRRTGMGGFWKEGADKIKRKMFHITEGQSQGMADVINHDASGYMPDVQEFLKGNPANMLNESDEDGLGQAARPIIKIGLNPFASAGVDAEHMMNRGVAILGLIDFLESRNQRCELWVLNRIQDRRTSFFDFGEGDGEEQPEVQFDVLIKKADEQWNPSSVAFCMSHPAWSRRIGFRLIESKKEMDRATQGGYGFSPKHMEDMDDYDIFFGYMTYGHDLHGTDEGMLDSVQNYTTLEGSTKYIQEIAHKASLL